MSKKRYEYKELPAYGSRPRDWITQFNALGEEGWEFCGTDCFRSTLFVRELEEGKTANAPDYEVIAPPPPPPLPAPPPKIVSKPPPPVPQPEPVASAPEPVKQPVVESPALIVKKPRSRPRKNK